MTKQKKALAPKPDIVPALQPVSHDTMIGLAMEKGDLAMLEKFMDLKERHEANEARKAYVQAMALFKSEELVIEKDQLVGYENKDGSKTGYSHASLGNVVQTITQDLAKYGFSHAWSLDQEHGISVTCTITHALGHSESVTMSAQADDSGKKNPIQQVASTVTYLERYTLLAATGCAAQEKDNDGAGAYERISEDQQNTIHALITENDLPMERIKSWMKSAMMIDAIEDIPVDWYDATIIRVESAIRAKQKKEATNNVDT